MKIPKDYKTVEGTRRVHATESKHVGPTDPGERITITLILRRQPGGAPLRGLEDFSFPRNHPVPHVSHEAFGEAYGAAPDELDRVVAFVRSHGLEVLEAQRDRRSVVARGTAGQLAEAFAVELHNYDSPRGRYHSYSGEIHLPHDLHPMVEAVIGLDNRPIPAKHYAADPPHTNPLSPLDVARLYDFPEGKGGGQTIGIYEMIIGNTQPGYTKTDVQQTLDAFGGNLVGPHITDVSIDGVTNSGVSDGETLLDITVASAVAQLAHIAVYFADETTQSVIHALQRMIHPGPGDPELSVISISYGWDDDDDTTGITLTEYNQMHSLFQDAANLGITVLVSSGDSGAEYISNTDAKTSYPATDPWVLACGGTTIGNINGSDFDEYVWNDSSGSWPLQFPGATGGGVSALFPVPIYQIKAGVPLRNGTRTSGRGIPDVAGNASVNSGYPQFIGGSSQGPIGGTSAVAPLYAGLFAVINGNLGFRAGFVNPLLYALTNRVTRDVTASAGPTTNNFDSVIGYPAGVGWDACTGLGSIKGKALQAELMLWALVPVLANLA